VISFSLYEQIIELLKIIFKNTGSLWNEKPALTSFACVIWFKSQGPLQREIRHTILKWNT